MPIAATVEALCERVLSKVARASAEVIFETAFAEDGFDGASNVAHDLVQRAIDATREGAKSGIACLAINLDRPVIGLGASAGLHYASLPVLVGNECVVPADADVANALGAVVGQVRVHAEARVSQPKQGLFRITLGDLIKDFPDEEKALTAAEEAASAAAKIRAFDAGSETSEIAISREISATFVDGQRMFIEATIIATASGRPRIAA